MPGQSGMDMNLEEIEFADHAALSVMEVLCKNLTPTTPIPERIAIAREAYRMAKEMVVTRRKFIQEHGDAEALGEGPDGATEEDDDGGDYEN